jgi:YidB-like protein
MSRGFPSMTALLGLLAVAGYQHRDKIAEILGGIGQSTPGATGQSGIGGFLGQLSESLGAASAGRLLSGGLGELVDRFKQSGHGETAESWVGSGANSMRFISPRKYRIHLIQPDTALKYNDFTRYKTGYDFWPNQIRETAISQPLTARDGGYDFGRARYGNCHCWSLTLYREDGKGASVEFSPACAIALASRRLAAASPRLS